MGTNQRVCIQILCPKEAREIKLLKESYKKREFINTSNLSLYIWILLWWYFLEFQRDLDKDLSDEEGGPLGKIFRSIAGAGRAENMSVDMNIAQKDAQDLYDVTRILSFLKDKWRKSFNFHLF